MKRESLISAISFTCFGVLVGWILGSQQAGTAVSPAPAVAPAASAAPADAAAAAPPLDLQKAADLERTASAQPANAAIRAELADLYFDASRYDLATPWYEATLKINPKNVNASTDLGVCYYYLNQVDRALTQLDHSLSIDPKHAKTLLNQGIVRAFGKQDLQGAIESWQKVVALAPGSDEAKRAQEALDALKSGHANGTGVPGAGRSGQP